MWLFCFAAITLIVAPSVKPQLLYEDDNIPLMNNPVEMRKMLLSLINTFDRKITENFTKLLARVQNDFQSQLRNQSAELIFVQKENNENKTFMNTFDRKNSENFTRLLAFVQNDFQSKLDNLSAELMSVQNENKKIKGKLLDLTKRQTDAQSYRYPTRPTVEAERNVDIQADIDAKIKEFEKLESSIQANLTLRLESNNVVMEDNKEVKRLLGYLNNTQTELTFKVDVLEKLLEEKAKWNERVAINESSLDNLERKTQVLNDTLHDLQMEGFVMKTNVSTIVTDRQKKADILEQMASKVTQQSIQLNETSQSINELKEQANNNRIYFANVTSTADNMRNELLFLKTSLDTLKNQTNYLNVDLTHVNSSVISDSQQIEENKMKINGYISQLSNLQMTVKSQETKLQNLQNAVENVGSLPSRCNDSQKPISGEKGVAKVTRISVIADGIRLVNGSSWNEGRVEVYESGGWGSVCSTEWNTMDASVVCKVVGFKYGVAITSGLFGLGSGPVQMTNVSCDGSESSIFGCLYNRTKECPTNQTAGVVCTNGSSVRLVNGTHEWEGLVEMYDGTWKGLCAQNWNTTEARVACRSLGFDGSTAVTQPFKMNQKINVKFPTYFDCRGHEKNLFECSHHRMPVNTGWYSNDECTQAEVRCIPVRLSGGYSSVEGRVEVFINNVWGTICNAGWSSVDSRVVCNTLFGYSYSGTKVGTGYLGRGVGDILLTNVSCTGSESNVLECKHSLMTDHCTHSMDVAVKCYQNIRLNNGIVEVYVNNQWGTVCGASWGNSEAKIVCRSLRLPSKYANAQRRYMYYYNYLSILIRYVKCRGTESSLFDCSMYTRYYCLGSQRAAVDCA